MKDVLNESTSLLSSFHEPTNFLMNINWQKTLIFATKIAQNQLYGMVHCYYTVCGKPWGKVSPILVTFTSRSDSDFERSNFSLKENKPDGVNPNSDDIDYYVRKNEGKILWFSADCTHYIGC